MDGRLSRGNNCDIYFLDNSVEKVTRHVFEDETAKRLAEQLILYADEFSNEPISTPALREVVIVPQAPGGSKIRFISDLCEDPNMLDLKGEDLHLSTRGLLSQIANMTKTKNGELLRIPIDACAQNFHVNACGGVLVDIFPPLIRHKDDGFPLENVQYSHSRIRRNLVPYIRGSFEGAILQTLFTAALGSKPQEQAWRIASDTQQWCHAAVPSSLSPKSKDRIHKHIKERFMRHFIRSSSADGVCLAQKLVGIKPYKDEL